MASELLRIKKRNEVRSELNKLYENSDRSLLIHYSCESFYDIKDGRTPRVTSIAVRNLKSAQTTSFSIHKIAEREGVDIVDIPEKYDQLEKKMLADFFDFVRCKEAFYFIHLNMRDENYGFAAIEHRFQVLGGQPYVIADDKKFDLSRSLISLFGRKYVGHGDGKGRFLTLVELNRITDRAALTGKQEADAFEAAEYVKLHQSTLRKVDCMSNIIERTVDGSLKTHASWTDAHGIHPKVLVEGVKDHWIWSAVVIVAVLTGLLGRLPDIFSF